RVLVAAPGRVRQLGEDELVFLGRGEGDQVTGVTGVRQRRRGGSRLLPGEAGRAELLVPVSVRRIIDRPRLRRAGPREAGQQERRQQQRSKALGDPHYDSLWGRKTRLVTPGGGDVAADGAYPIGVSRPRP